jgi:hypothetical protein
MKVVGLMKGILVLSFCFSLIFLTTILFLIWKQHLKEQYAILWIIFSIALIIISVNPNWLDLFANITQIKYAPSLLFLVGIIFSFFIILSLTIQVSILSTKLIKLSQEFALRDIHFEKEDE